MRIDRFLAARMPDLSRSYLQKLLADGHVLVGGSFAKNSLKLRTGDRVEAYVPTPVELSARPEEMPLDIVYEDDDLLVVNKPKGLAVHPGAGHPSGTLVNGLLAHCQGRLSGINGVLRPGIVHRIDMDTTGLLVVCKTDAAHRSLAAQLEAHTITRRYHAVVEGAIPDGGGARENPNPHPIRFLESHAIVEGAIGSEGGISGLENPHTEPSSGTPIISPEGKVGTIDCPIGRDPKNRLKMSVRAKEGKRAVTHYRVLERFPKYTYIMCELETGRTHQIRVHMASIGHPVLGDTLYGRAKQPFKTQGQVLHAKTLGFTHPTSGAYMEFDAPLPAYFEALLAKMRSM
ncbi:MAG: RluA family pseudouridine synthase [Lachnospiraceae bacterium]|nr:RluA family pseudouridine synthase [Lachnospiraceae bacterium]